MRISQPVVVGALLLFDLLNFAASGFSSFVFVAVPAQVDWLLPACGVFTVTVVGICVLHGLWSYTIRAPGDFARQNFNLFIAFAAALALWDAGCVLAGLGQAQLALLRPWTLRWFACGLGAGLIGRALFTQVTGRWTREGRLARRIRGASPDELPQLFNVLKGDLSLVGSRPHALNAKAAGMIYERVVEGYFARHRVKPGMTGWAQINGWRGETDTVEKIEQRLAHDHYYIENWSLWLDIKILAKTPIAVLFPRNAY